MKAFLGTDDEGNLVGESHPRARLTDDEVKLIRDLYDEGLVGYRTLARTFGVSRNTIKCIVKFRRRNATATNFKPVCMGKQK